MWTFLRYTIENFMPNTVFASNSGSMRKRLLLGVLGVFILLFALGYWVFHKSKIIDTYPIEILNQNYGPVIAATPEEVKNNYQTAVSQIQAELADPSKTTEQKNKALEDFFFSARVPQELREAHLQALLKTQSAGSIEQKVAIVSTLSVKGAASTSTPQ